MCLWEDQVDDLRSHELCAQDMIKIYSKYIQMFYCKQILKMSSIYTMHLIGTYYEIIHYKSGDHNLNLWNKKF